MDEHDLLRLVIFPSLEKIGFDEDYHGGYMVLNTGIAETYLELEETGLFGMTKEMHNDIHQNFLNIKMPFYLESRPYEDMIYDMRYAAQMCRIQYLRFTDPLPDLSNLNKQSEYWLKYYNPNGDRHKFVNSVRYFGN